MLAISRACRKASREYIAIAIRFDAAQGAAAFLLSCMTSPAILLIGNAARPEFAPAADALAAMGNVCLVPDLDAALHAVEADVGEPELIVLLQDRGGQFPLANVERLRLAAPLARWASVLGTWCEGEPRTGRPLPGMLRLPWTSALALLADSPSGIPAWARPETSSEEEDVLAANPPTQTPRQNGRSAFILAPIVDSGLVLADALRANGWSCQTARMVDGAAAQSDADLVVADLPGADLDPLELARVVAWSGRSPVLAVRGFWRSRDAAVAHGLGVRAILGKPWRLSALHWLANLVVSH